MIVIKVCNMGLIKEILVEVRLVGEMNDLWFFIRIFPNIISTVILNGTLVS